MFSRLPREAVDYFSKTSSETKIRTSSIKLENIDWEPTITVGNDYEK